MAKTEKELIKAGKLFYRLLSVVLIIIILISLIVTFSCFLKDELFNYEFTLIVRMLIALCITLIVWSPIYEYYR